LRVFAVRFTPAPFFPTPCRMVLPRFAYSFIHSHLHLFIYSICSLLFHHIWYLFDFVPSFYCVVSHYFMYCVVLSTVTGSAFTRLRFLRTTRAARSYHVQFTTYLRSGCTFGFYIRLFSRLPHHYTPHTFGFSWFLPLHCLWFTFVYAVRLVLRFGCTAGCTTFHHTTHTTPLSLPHLVGLYTPPTIAVHTRFITTRDHTPHTPATHGYRLRSAATTWFALLRLRIRVDFGSHARLVFTHLLPRLPAVPAHVPPFPTATRAHALRSSTHLPTTPTRFTLHSVVPFTLPRTHCRYAKFYAVTAVVAGYTCGYISHRFVTHGYTRPSTTYHTYTLPFCRFLPPGYL